MRKDPTQSQRQQVRDQAEGRCEYCRHPDSHTTSAYEVDHANPVRDGGQTVLEYLAYSCGGCNNQKRDSQDFLRVIELLKKTADGIVSYIYVIAPPYGVGRIFVRHKAIKRVESCQSIFWGELYNERREYRNVEHSESVQERELNFPRRPAAY